MKKYALELTAIILSLIAIASLFLIILSNQFSITGETIDDIYTYTKAICNDKNYCEDYTISCKNSELESFNPTGYAIQFPKDHQAQETDLENLCYR